MSTTEEVSPTHFHCTYIELVAISIKKEAYFRRDIADLKLRGVTTTRLDAYVVLRNNFLGIPSSPREIQTTSIGYIARNAKNNELIIATREVLGIAQSTFTKKSPEYRSFNVKGLTKLNPDEMYQYAGNVFAKATENTIKMTANGMTPTMLTNITTISGELLVLIGATPILEGSSAAVTVNRRIAANALYDETKSMCEIAIVYYQDRDKLKKSNYVIYDTKPKTIQRKGKIKANGFATPKQIAYLPTTKIRIKIPTGTSVEVYFSMKKKGAIATKSLLITANPNIFTTVTAAELGFDALGGILVLNLKNNITDEATFLIKIG